MKEIDVRDLKINPYTLFAENWAALCSGNEKDGFNAMTIAWGQIGSLWEKETHSHKIPVVTVYVRPSRYTKKLMDENDLFSVCFLPQKERKALGYLGSHHGSAGSDKIAEAGLTALKDADTVYVKEAQLVLVCRKIYAQDLKPECFHDPELVPFNYPEGDFHTMYTGEITKVLVAD